MCLYMYMYVHICICNIAPEAKFFNTLAIAHGYIYYMRPREWSMEFNGIELDHSLRYMDWAGMTTNSGI